MECQQCGKVFEAKSKRAKYCSDACRVAASRSRPVIKKESGKEEMETEDRVYRFRTFHYKGTSKKEKIWSEVRYARTWLDVPLAGEPVLQDGWPEKPDYMDNRQYYLWWDNNFKMNGDKPVITNPHPNYDKLVYDMGGDSARKWGA